jgi:hypothetical protein
MEGLSAHRPGRATFLRDTVNGAIGAYEEQQQTTGVSALCNLRYEIKNMQ